MFLKRMKNVFLESKYGSKSSNNFIVKADLAGVASVTIGASSLAATY